MHYYQVFNYLIMFDSFLTNKSFVIEAFHKNIVLLPVCDFNWKVIMELICSS